MALSGLPLLAVSAQATIVIKVGSILVLPGWFIARRSKPVVTVLSGSEVGANIPKLIGAATNDREIRRLAAIIEDRNRSIEY